MERKINMRDYPNMSYCMFANTVNAMSQILESIDDAKIGDGVVDFFESLSREERRNLQHLFNQCEEFMNQAQDIWDRVDEARVENE
jgi:hypothetical protein